MDLEDKFEGLIKKITDENVILRFESIWERQEFCELITRASCKLYIVVWFPLVTDFMINIGIIESLALNPEGAIARTVAPTLRDCSDCRGWHIICRREIAVANMARLNMKPPLPPLDLITDLRLLYQQNKCKKAPINFDQLIAGLPASKRRQIEKPTFN